MTSCCLSEYAANLFPKATLEMILLVRVITVSTEERRAFILEWITREEDGILAKQDETMVVD